ncbi:hypothetical protein M0804_007960 [Polistes exclamans]|nr:hypothetical protein M0804_007960 [Polistes exclamans]
MCYEVGIETSCLVCVSTRKTFLTVLPMTGLPFKRNEYETNVTLDVTILDLNHEHQAKVAKSAAEVVVVVVVVVAAEVAAAALPKELLARSVLKLRKPYRVKKGPDKDIRILRRPSRYYVNPFGPEIPHVRTK